MISLSLSGTVGLAFLCFQRSPHSCSHQLALLFGLKLVQTRAKECLPPPPAVAAPQSAEWEPFSVLAV